MNDLKDIENLKPFPHFCYTIGMLPSSYKTSMTYEEQLIWLCDYLEKTVIPTVNNNGGAVTELQNLFVQLKTYTDNYFNNLDVQNEINNKLDKMASDGTLTSIINNNIFKDINNKVLQNSIDIGKNKEDIKNAITTNSTNVITSDMLTQEVKEQMTGGSVAVVEENSVAANNIQNNAIDILNLDESLKNNFIKNFKNIDYETNYSGFVTYENNNIKLQEDSSYNYGIIPLEKDNIYYYSVTNSFLVNGLIVIDNITKKLIFDTKTVTSEGNVKVSGAFRVNRDNLVAYIQKFAPTNSKYNLFNDKATNITKISNLSLNLTKENYSINKLLTIDNYWVSTYSVIGESPLIKTTLNTENESKIDIYKMSKGTKYKIIGKNHYEIAGLAILTENLLLSYLSQTTPQVLNDYQYEFIAPDNGYIVTSYYKEPSGRTVDNTVMSLYDEQEKYYDNVNWCTLGDSLTDKATLGENVKNYTNYISDKLNLNLTNVGLGGTGYATGGNKNGEFFNQVNNIPSNTNLVTLFGSFNDLYVNKSIGTIKDNDTNTICGCINKTFDNIINKVPNAIIGVILPTPWQNFYGDNNFSSTTYNNPIPYLKALKDICEYRSIPYLDLYRKSNLRPWEELFRQNYYLNADGVHPNTYGHLRISGQISEFIKSLIL